MLLKEVINSYGEYDLQGLTELDIEYLCNMVYTVNGGPIKLKQEEK